MLLSDEQTHSKSVLYKNVLNISGECTCTGVGKMKMFYTYTRLVCHYQTQQLTTLF